MHGLANFNWTLLLNHLLNRSDKAITHFYYFYPSHFQPLHLHIPVTHQQVYVNLIPFGVSIIQTRILNYNEYFHVYKHLMKIQLLRII